MNEQGEWRGGSARGGGFPPSHEAHADETWPGRTPVLHALPTAAGAVVDRTALQLMALLWLSDGDPSSEAHQERQRRAHDRYGDPALRADRSTFFPEPRPAAIEEVARGALRGGARVRWRWPSGYRTFDPSYQGAYDGWEENRTAWAESLFHEEPGRPAIVCLHSWATGFFGFQHEVYRTRSWYRAGFDVVVPILPFHGPRTPRGAWFGGQLFPGTCPRRTNEGFGQAAWDLRALLGRLRARGAGPIGVMGMSLGGYLAALLAALDETLAFSIPMIPMASMADLLWKHGEGRPERKRAEARGVTLDRMREAFGVHSPLTWKPRVPRDRRLIVAGRGDRVTDPTHVRMLWEHWERPRIHWFPGGHNIHFGRGALFREVERFARSAVEV